MLSKLLEQGGKLGYLGNRDRPKHKIIITKNALEQGKKCSEFTRKYGVERYGFSTGIEYGNVAVIENYNPPKIENILVVDSLDNKFDKRKFMMIVQNYVDKKINVFDKDFKRRAILLRHDGSNFVPIDLENILDYKWDLLTTKRHPEGYSCCPTENYVNKFKNIFGSNSTHPIIEPKIKPSPTDIISCLSYIEPEEFKSNYVLETIYDKEGNFALFGFSVFTLGAMADQDIVPDSIIDSWLKENYENLVFKMVDDKKEAIKILDI